MNTNEKKPDHTLQNSTVPSVDEPPQVYSVTDLRAFVKPELDEVLESPAGHHKPEYGQTICSCVPVETCVCNTVTYRVGGGCPCTGTLSCGTTCSVTCTCQVTGGSLYWFPY